MKFDKADPIGAANNTSATATDLGAVVNVRESGLTVFPSDEDWFTVTARAYGLDDRLDSDFDVAVQAEGDPVHVEVFEDIDSDGLPDGPVLGDGTGNDIRIEDISALRGETLWVRIAPVDPTDLDAPGSLFELEVINEDRFDDPLGDGYGSPPNNPTGEDRDGPNDGPRTAGEVVEGTLRLVQPDAAVPATSQGRVAASIDGLRTFTTGELQVDVPSGSTVELALLYVATRSFFGPYCPTAISFQGSNVTLEYLPNVDNGSGVDFETARADVTSIVSDAVGSGGGVFDFEVDETGANAGPSADGNDEHLDQGIEGTALVVLYSNPALPVRTIAVLEGGLTGPVMQTTRVFLTNPLDKSDPDFIARLSLGISCGNLSEGQYSTVTVNGDRMTSSAGDFDDGHGDDGALITVGGHGDAPANPLDPFDIADATDDEFYDLAPFLGDGSTKIMVETANPSDDDSIFLAIITVSGEAGVAGLLTNLGVLELATGPIVEHDLRVPWGDEDWYRFEVEESRHFAVTVEFEPDGYAEILMYRDENDDGLPDDLNGDGVPDPVGIVTTRTNQVRVTEAPSLQPGDVCFLRLFNPIGQVEYDLNIYYNRSPVPHPDYPTMDEDTAIDIDVLANDEDPDGDPLTVDSVDTTDTVGLATINPDDTIHYDPNGQFESLAAGQTATDSFDHTVSDGHGGTDTATVTVTIHGVDDMIEPSEISGMVWEDFNNDGEIDFDEKAIEGVTIILNGTDDRGAQVNLTDQTDEDGVYAFYDLRPREYTISEVQPVSFVDGKDILGTVNGTITAENSENDIFSGVILPEPGSVAENYNFGERPWPGVR